MNGRIKKVRELAGLTQSEFAERIGVGFSSISKLEKGKNNPSERTIRAICREFGIDRFWLETGEGDMYYEFDALRVGEVQEILRGSVAESRIDLVTQILEMTPEEIDLVSKFLEAMNVYARRKGENDEKTSKQ